ncbi:MAG: class I SAM-dependent RNA methyltransferase [Clostridia bacterium]|nr:class I SAM-dependent RNA methyltransferase [Clostridia bacterium]MBQ7289197.1 class I SAM-dependent RNA methyltransferase [Clostridia bacterium]
MNIYNFIAPCMFGVEGILADELRRLGAADVRAENGRVLFRGDDTILARTNLQSRYAERITIAIGCFTATTFTELFDQVKNLPFENYISSKDAFPVTGWSLNSQLHSVPDCQAIIKKAIVERLKGIYHISWFEESGPEHRIRFSVMKNEVTIMLETSGFGLHKRGYRKNANAAPIKETLAAAMCNLAHIYPDTYLLDPFCGSGTILIEAALMAKHMAPGLKNAFISERYGFINNAVWQQERAAARDEILENIDFRAVGYDIDPAAVALTNANAKKAGVEKYVEARVADISEFSMPEERALVITNPPYGERMMDIAAAERLYQTMGARMPQRSGNKYFIITADEDFETHFGRKADKQRKLYNGMLKCNYYMYFKSMR